MSALLMAVAGGVVWLVLGYKQYVVHRDWTDVGRRTHAALYVAEFTAAIVCLTGFVLLAIRALH